MTFLAPLLGVAAGGLMGKQATSPAATGQQSSVNNSSQQSQSSSNSGPYAGAQNGLNMLYNGATDVATNHVPQMYPYQTLADQSWATQHGLNMAQAAALAGGASYGGAGAVDAAQANNTQTSQGQYLTSDPTRGALAEDSNFDANNMFGMGGLNQFGVGGNIGQTAGMRQLAGIGNGQMLNSNPYVDSMFNQAADQVGQQFSKYTMPGVASMFAGAGRMGSNQMADGMGMATQQFGNTLNNLATNIYGGNYSNERSLQNQALNQLSNIGLGERQQQLGALGQQTQNQLTGQQLQFQNLQELSNQYGRERQNMMQANSMAPAMQQLDYNDANAMMGVGGARDQYGQAQINDAISRWDTMQNASRDNINWLNSIMSGAPQQSSSNSSSSGSSSGVSNGTSMTPGNPMAPLQGMMMGGLLGSSIGKLFP